MSRKIRLGNDVPVDWSLLDGDGNQYAVAGKDFRVELLVGARRVRIADATADGNTIRFTYYGKEQRTTGKVNLVYIENEGKPEMITFDTEDAFELVPHSWQAVDDGEIPETVTVETVTITSFLSVAECPVKKGSGTNSVCQVGTGADAPGDNSFAEGDGVSSGEFSHAEGFGTESFGDFSHAEGENTTADGERSHAEGYGTNALGENSHSEGWNTTAKQSNSHSEGRDSVADGNAAHAEGRSTQANEQNAHAEGYQSIASGMNSHAEGFSTQASGHSSHAEGRQTLAKLDYCHAEGRGTEASHSFGEHAEGTFNYSHANTIHSIGIGANANDRKNAVEVMTTGFAYFLGVGGYNGTNPSRASSLAEVIADIISRLEALENNS